MKSIAACVLSGVMRAAITLQAQRVGLGRRGFIPTDGRRAERDRSSQWGCRMALISYLLVLSFCMNTQQRKTLELVFANPPNGNLAWRKIESLLLAVGCVRTVGAGSSVAFMHSGISVRFHRPHPQREALRYRVLDARKFLEAIGVTP